MAERDRKTAMDDIRLLFYTIAEKKTARPKRQSPVWFIGFCLTVIGEAEQHPSHDIKMQR
jgi:hypothetical protein